jgi:hypothetical protein
MYIAEPRDTAIFRAIGYVNVATIWNWDSCTCEKTVSDNTVTRSSVYDPARSAKMSPVLLFLSDSTISGVKFVNDFIV